MIHSVAYNFIGQFVTEFDVSAEKPPQYISWKRRYFHLSVFVSEEGHRIYHEIEIVTIPDK